MKDLTAASSTTAWVVVANKPFYPLYVWWLAGSGWRASLWTLAALPLFLALPFVARRAPLVARAGLPLVGVIDTAFSAFVFGEGSGVESFLIPCAALAALSFTRDEAWTSRVLTAGVFVAFSGLRWLAPAGIGAWPAGELPAMVNLNLYSAAALTAFVGLRFAAAR
jgi:hypothetical protein